MTKFVTLTAIDGTEMIINAVQISALLHAGQGTQIIMVGGGGYHAAESMAEVKTILDIR